MDRVPFLQEAELCHELSIENYELCRRVLSTNSVPASNSVVARLKETRTLPGEARIRVSDGATKIAKHLSSELKTEELDKLSPHLWLLAKPDSKHIASLTEQPVRGRQIIITEDPPVCGYI
jgi:hypothetical protein